jgi:hypothetical protein
MPTDSTCLTRSEVVDDMIDPAYGRSPAVVNYDVDVMSGSSMGQLRRQRGGLRSVRGTRITMTRWTMGLLLEGVAWR